jgi:hypothetical protein
MPTERSNWLPVVLAIVGLWLAAGLVAWQLAFDPTPAPPTIPPPLGGEHGDGKRAAREGEGQPNALADWVFAQVAAVAVVLTGLVLWTARDARSRGLEGWAWLAAFVALSAGLFWFLYLKIRPPGRLDDCVRCGGGRLASAPACPHCGLVGDGWRAPRAEKARQRTASADAQPRPPEGAITTSARTGLTQFAGWPLRWLRRLAGGGGPDRPEAER